MPVQCQLWLGRETCLLHRFLVQSRGLWYHGRSAPLEKIAASVAGMCHEDLYRFLKENKLGIDFFDHI